MVARGSSASVHNLWMAGVGKRTGVTRVISFRERTDEHARAALLSRHAENSFFHRAEQPFSLVNLHRYQM